MRGPLRVAAIVLLGVSLGLHWAALQSVAWASMFFDRVQTGTVAEALQSTFDGKHPCPICLVVRDGRAAERQQPAAAPSSESYSPKLDLTLASDPIQLLADDGALLPPALARQLFSSRSEPPPLPPPRSV